MSDSATPWTIVHHAPLSVGFSRQEHRSGLPFPSPGDPPDAGIEPGSPALQADSSATEPRGKPQTYQWGASNSKLCTVNGIIEMVLHFPHLYLLRPHYLSVQFSSVAQSYSTLCDPMNRSTPGLPVHHKLPEFTQTHAHRVNDASQPSHPLSSPPPPAPNPSQHQGLFQ